MCAKLIVQKLNYSHDLISRKDFRDPVITSEPYFK